MPLPTDPMMLALAVALPWTSGARELRLAARLMTSGVSDAIAHLEAELDRDRADVIVADFAFFAAALVAERRNLPLVAFFHSGLPFPIQGRHPFADGEAFSRTIDARIAKVRRDAKLPPTAPGILDSPYSPDLNLLATTPALEGRDLNFGLNTKCVGPCVDGRAETDFPLERLRADAVKIYLSLGTVFNRHPARFLALIEGLSGPGVQIIVSAGPSYDALVGLASSELLIFRTVPQLAVLKAVDFVVSHGGNNTVNEALVAGKSLLVLPIGGEQEANARRVERLGAGIPLDRDRLTPQAVRAAFTRLRSEPGFAAKAKALASETHGASEAAQLIVQLARRHRPTPGD
jgi:MGT family glycosyltransferase